MRSRRVKAFEVIYFNKKPSQKVIFKSYMFEDTYGKLLEVADKTN